MKCILRIPEIRITFALLCLSALLLSCSADPTRTAVVDGDVIGALSVIPKPTSVSGDRGHLHLGSDSRIVVSEETRDVGELLAGTLRASTGWEWSVVVDDPGAADVDLRIDVNRRDLGDEGYVIVVDDRTVSVLAATNAGVFYGTRTLLQLLPAAVERSTATGDVTWRVPMVSIEDRPRFGWRGTMLDVARHFFGVDQIKRLLDLAASYKINRFHLHLTDDAGWRIEVQSWPDLTAIGSTTDHSGGGGGFYTQQDFGEIVAYADARFITVIPEIDMPGHTNAALASYAGLNESGERTELTPTVPFGSSSLWIDGPDTERFVDDVVREISALTSGPYFHIGGDEALATTEEEYGNFIPMVQRIVASHGKEMIGWADIGQADLEPPVIAQHWFLVLDNALMARDQGAQIISSPAESAYLDMKYDESTPIGLSWAGFINVRAAYEWDPVLEGLNENDVLGVEAPLWTETVDTVSDIDLLMFPRLLGYAELGWSSAEGRTWDEYALRLAKHGPRLEAREVAFFRSPFVDWE